MNDIDDQYRRAAAQDPSQPSESTRQKILAHAAELAAQRAAGNAPLRPDFRGPAANQPSWRPALVGTLAAAGLAGLLITPLFLSQRVPPSVESSLTVAGKARGERNAEQPRVLPAPLTAPIESPPPVARLAPAARQAAPAPTPKYNSAEQGTSVAEQAATADTTRVYSGAAPEYAAAPSPAPARDSAAEAGAPARSAPLAAASRLAGAARADNTGAALQQAAEAGDLARLEALLAAPADINARDSHGRTALMLATLRGQAGAVDALLAHGADVNIADAGGITPLQAALASAQPGIAAALQRAGAR